VRRTIRPMARTIWRDTLVEGNIAFWHGITVPR
jgi:hypothetical protein